MGEAALARPTLLTFAEAAAALRVGPKTLREVIRSGALPAGKLGSTWRVRSDDLDAYLEALCRSNAEVKSGTTTSPSTVIDIAGRRASGTRRRRSGSKTESASVLPWDQILAKASPSKT